MKAKVYIMPKKDVLDPQGKAVNQSLHSLGFENVFDVRVGKYLEISLSDGASKEENETIVSNMCKKLLVNEVIEDFHFKICGCE